jgi:hypothetical protein
MGGSINHLFKFACLLAIVACDSTGPESTSLLFDGIVTEAGTGAAIENAAVSVSDLSGSSGLVGKELQSTRTDSQGRYTLSYNRCAAYPFIYVIATGYQLVSEKVGCKSERQVMNVSLSRGPLVSR